MAANAVSLQMIDLPPEMPDGAIMFSMCSRCGETTFYSHDDHFHCSFCSLALRPDRRYRIVFRRDSDAAEALSCARDTDELLRIGNG